VRKSIKPSPPEIIHLITIKKAPNLPLLDYSFDYNYHRRSIKPSPAKVTHLIIIKKTPNPLLLRLSI